MDILFWVFFLITVIVAFSILLKTNTKINKLVAKKEFFPEDPQLKYFKNKNDWFFTTFKYYLLLSNYCY